MPGAPLSVPNVGIAVWPAYVVTGKAGGALAFGDFVSSSDNGVSWNKATGKLYDVLKGIVLDDAAKSSFLTNDTIAVGLYGVFVAVSDGAIVDGNIIENGATTAGRVQAYAVGTDTIAQSHQAIAGRSLGPNATAAAVKILVGLGYR